MGDVVPPTFAEVFSRIDFMLPLLEQMFQDTSVWDVIHNPLSLSRELRITQGDAERLVSGAYGMNFPQLRRLTKTPSLGGSVSEGQSLRTALSAAVALLGAHTAETHTAAFADLHLASRKAVRSLDARAANSGETVAGARYAEAVVDIAGLLGARSLVEHDYASLRAKNSTQALQTCMAPSHNFRTLLENTTPATWETSGMKFLTSLSETVIESMCRWEASTSKDSAPFQGVQSLVEQAPIADRMQRLRDIIPAAGGERGYYVGTFPRHEVTEVPPGFVTLIGGPKRSLHFFFEHQGGSVDYMGYAGDPDGYVAIEFKKTRSWDVDHGLLHLDPAAADYAANRRRRKTIRTLRLLNSTLSLRIYYDDMDNKEAGARRYSLFYSQEGGGTGMTDVDGELLELFSFGRPMSREVHGDCRLYFQELMWKEEE